MASVLPSDASKDDLSITASRHSNNSNYSCEYSDPEATNVVYIRLRRIPEVQPSFMLVRTLYAMKRGIIFRIGRFTVKTITHLDLWIENAVYRLNHDYIYQNKFSFRRTSNTLNHMEYNDLDNSDYAPQTVGLPLRGHHPQDIDEYLDRTKQKIVQITKSARQPLGFSITTNSDDLMKTAYVCGITPGGAAADMAELQVGDKVISINGKSVVGLSEEEIYQKLLETHPLTAVTLSVIYSPLVFDFDLKRIRPHNHLGMQVLDAVIVRVSKDGLAYKMGIRSNHRITKLEDGEFQYTHARDITRILHAFVGTIKIYTMAVPVFNAVGKEAMRV
eukprot:CFRG7119T1